MWKWITLLAWIFVLFSGGTLAATSLHHQLQVEIYPTQNSLEVVDTLTFKAGEQNSALVFKLHAALKIKRIEISGNAVPINSVDQGATAQGVSWAAYSLPMPPEGGTAQITYAGQIGHKVSPGKEDYARSFSDTPGLIHSGGTYLAATSLWYPYFDNDLITFGLQVTVPGDWEAISQGERKKHIRSVTATQVEWEEQAPQDEIFLIAGPYQEYTQHHGQIEAMVFLREADPALAQKYLDTTGQYISMYNELLGPYPYKKFALVENFWESGYGMPSFTLLGSRIIRFPFILHSSFPHEILHNWWGNGVYVDYQQGNWAEGLTAYLADHLVKEQRGEGVIERRNVLQKYSDYVNNGQDFPLIDFRSRHSSATEAIGYGKTLMLFHMLRQKMGDHRFVHALRTLYQEYRFKRASYSDLEKIFSTTHGSSLKSFFSQWVNHAGAPELHLANVQVVTKTDGYELKLDIEQKQVGVVYELDVPVSVTLEGVDAAFQTVVQLTDTNSEVSISVPARPIHLDIDSEFDVFRRLDSQEIPAALSQGFGSEQVLLVLPKAASTELAEGYLAMAKTWQQSQNGNWQIVYDADLTRLPTDKTIWLLGWENRFLSEFKQSLPQNQVDLGATSVRLADSLLSKPEHSLVLTARYVNNPEQTLLWVASNRADALPGLTRKLPHYRKYSYLGFAGTEPSNIAKGQWRVTTSPLSQSLPGLRTASQTNTAKMKTRSALASLPPLFSQHRMMQTISILADEQLAGRGLGSPELDKAADYIAAAFKQAGLETTFQEWQETIDGKPGITNLKNVIAVIPGSDPAFAGQSVVIGAHYDHLGLGWPDVHAGDEGKIHFGADDNASGIAVMLELAKNMAKSSKPKRSIIFVAFSAEEAGRLGSRYYVQHSDPYPAEKIIAMLNLDTVGRLGDNDITVFGTGTASEWVHIFRGAGFVTGYGVNSVKKDAGFSDQKSFHEVGVPAVQFFGSVHADFHRPSDTIDKIDGKGLIKMATVLKEAVAYLAERPVALTVSDAIKKNRNSDAQLPLSAPKKGRKVSLGTIPDFNYSGEGVRITGVIPDSPAALAGLLEGDVLQSLDGKKLKDLAAYAKVLRNLAVGAKVTLIWHREKKTMSQKLELVPR
ncbi:PDZ domain [hydrothermal vent metagenome]|uniref:PDZ domain n=1 Tax=hydrothermal vent metagenome TaxID=652676 RepID=A0A3B0ZF24_9ZZZZ